MPRAALALVLLCLHCGSQTTAAPVTEEPASPPPATPAPEETSAPPAASAPAEAPASTAPASPTGTASPGKRPCPELDKTTCQITTGCAWNDLKKCVVQP